MNIVIFGGTGQLGQLLLRHWASAHSVHVVGRGTEPAWDGKSLGDWVRLVDGADVVVNLAGRSVDCRYTQENLREMMESRVDSTRVVGQAIAEAQQPPKVWLQMSTATIYAHSATANDEMTGVIGGNEPDVPAYWKRSVDIAEAWEAALEEAATPKTRKLALRTAMVMSPDPGGVFDVLLKMVKLRLGGAVAGGRQYVSWIHGDDFARALDFLIAHEELEGAVNLCAPEPLPQADFNRALREAAGVGLGLPAAAWMAKIGAWVLRTDTELLFKSRRVVPTRLMQAGFQFDHTRWPEAAKHLVQASPPVLAAAG